MTATTGWPPIRRATRSRPRRRPSRGSATKSTLSRPPSSRPRPSLLRRRRRDAASSSNSTRQPCWPRKRFASRQTLEQAQANRDQAVAAVHSAQAAIDVGRRPMSPCSRASSRRRAHPRRAQGRACQGRARPVVHRDPRADRRRHRQPRRPGRRLSCRPGSASRASCRSTTSTSTPISRRRSSARLRPGQPVSIAVDALPEHDDRRHRSRASRRPPARCSRCCRPTTRPAISPRSCSACRCASACPAEVAAKGVLRPGMSVVVSVNTKPRARADAACRARAAARRQPS